MSFNAITYYISYQSLSRIMAHCSQMIYACYQNMPQNLFVSCLFATSNLAERLYTSYNLNFTFIVHAQKRQAERFLCRENVSVNVI